jgi:hypothetical protein
VDNEDPVFQTNTLSRERRSAFPTINFSATDNETKIAYYKLKLLKNNKTIKNWRKQQSTFYIVPADVKPGTYTLLIRAYDKAGNKGEKRVTVNLR